MTDPSTSKYQPLPVQLHPEMYRELKLVAADLNVSMALLVRRALAQLLSMEGRPELIVFRERKGE